MANSFKDVVPANEKIAMDIVGKEHHRLSTKDLIAKIVSLNPAGMTFNEITIGIVELRPNYRTDLIVALDELIKEEVLFKESYVWKTTPDFQKRVAAHSVLIFGKTPERVRGINLQTIRDYIEDWAIFDLVGMSSYPESWTNQYRVGYHVFSVLSRITPTEAIDNVEIFNRVADAFKEGRPKHDALVSQIGVALNAFEGSCIVQTDINDDNVYSLTGMARRALEEIKGRRKVVTETFQTSFIVLGRELTSAQVYSMIQMLTRWVGPTLDFNDCSINLYGIVFTKKLAGEVLGAMAEDILFERLLHDLGYQKPPAA